jgi:hypothetical protein
VFERARGRDLDIMTMVAMENQVSDQSICAPLDAEVESLSLFASLGPLQMETGVKKPECKRNRRPSLTKKIRTIKCSVTFSESHDVHVRHSLPREESEKLWYQQEEYKSFKNECRSTVVALHRASGDVASLSNSQHCLRGLEHAVWRRAFKQKRMRQLSLVLGQQEYQRNNRLNDPYALQYVAMEFSRPDSEIAVQKAALDSLYLS